MYLQIYRGSAKIFGQRSSEVGQEKRYMVVLMNDTTLSKHGLITLDQLYTI